MDTIKKNLKKLGDKLGVEKIKNVKLDEVNWEDVILVASGVSIATVNTISLLKKGVKVLSGKKTSGAGALINVLGVGVGAMVASLPLRADAEKVEVEGELFEEGEEQNGEENIAEVLSDTPEEKGKKKQHTVVPVDTETTIEDFQKKK